jgi:hypothetical protein
MEESPSCNPAVGMDDAILISPADHAPPSRSSACLASDLRGFRPLTRFPVLRGRKGTDAPGKGWPQLLNSAIGLEGQDDQTIRQRIEAQVQSAHVAVIGFTSAWPHVGLIVNDGRATRRTSPGHRVVRTLARYPLDTLFRIAQTTLWSLGLVS